MTAFNDLASRHCRPLKGPEHRLDGDAIAERLRALPGWSLLEDGSAIGRTFRFEDYHRTMAFVNAVAWIAHREDHHPEIAFGFNRCTLRFNTHSVGGISINDFICAAKVDALAA
jgi:4a-hydroxytetrahydrobiopterin dehydratase